MFAALPKLWRIAYAKNYITAADFVLGEHKSRGLEFAIAVTGILATMPYIALQLVGMEVVLKGLGLTGEWPLVIAFVILATYTYSSGLRAPAMIAFVKDTMIYVVVIAAAIVIPMKLGGYAAVFAAADAAFQMKGGTVGLILTPAQMLPFATLALGSAFALMIYPHSLTAVLASSNADVIRRNAMLLPAYSAVLGLIALLGLMAHAAGIKVNSASDVVPALINAMFPSWFAGFAFAVIAIGALVPAAIGAANLFTHNHLSIRRSRRRARPASPS